MNSIPKNCFASPGVLSLKLFLIYFYTALFMSSCLAKTTKSSTWPIIVMLSFNNMHGSGAISSSLIALNFINNKSFHTLAASSNLYKILLRFITLDFVPSSKNIYLGCSAQTGLPRNPFGKAFLKSQCVAVHSLCNGIHNISIATVKCATWEKSYSR